MSLSRKLDRQQQVPTKARGMVHEMIAETAKGIAAVVYEECAHDDTFYKLWPSQKAFVRRRWQSFIQPARESLVSMLEPHNHYMSTEHMREKIHEALLLNAVVNPAINSPLN